MGSALSGLGAHEKRDAHFEDRNGGGESEARGGGHSEKLLDDGRKRGRGRKSFFDSELQTRILLEVDKGEAEGGGGCKWRGSGRRSISSSIR